LPIRSGEKFSQTEVRAAIISACSNILNIAYVQMSYISPPGSPALGTALSVTRMSENRWRTKRIGINMKKRLDFKIKKKYSK
jgi:hypothetical protein